MTGKFNRFAVGAALLASFALTPARAYADQIDYRGLNRGTTVSIGGVRTGTFGAGEMSWQWIGTTPEGFARDFYAYCVDVSQNLRDPQTVTRTTTAGFTNGVVDGGAKAAWLVNTYGGTVHGAATVTEQNTRAAALQVAIWEAMYDSTKDLTTGSFRLTGTSLTNGVRNQADIYLSALYGDNNTSYNMSVARLLEVRSPNLGQDQIVSSVSEPSTLLLMGVAFLLFAKRARKQGVPIAER